MRSFQLLVLLLLLFWSAGCSAQTHRQRKSTVLSGQYQPEQVKAQSGLEWFGNGVATYAPDKKVIEQLRQSWTPAHSAVIVAGSWCPDTHRDLPSYYKALQAAGIPESSQSLWFVDRRFRKADGISKQYQVTSVPTFVVLKEGKEVGRFAGRPGIKVESELLRVLQK